MGIPDPLRKAAETVAKLGDRRYGHATGTQAILEAPDVASARAIACEVARALARPASLPLYVLAGNEYESHAALFSRFQQQESGTLVP